MDSSPSLGAQSFSDGEEDAGLGCIHPCPYNAVCHIVSGSGKCFCVENLTEVEFNGTCTPVPVFNHSGPNVKDSFFHEKLKDIIDSQDGGKLGSRFGQAENETHPEPISSTTAGPDTGLQIILPLVLVLVSFCLLLALFLWFRRRHRRRHGRAGGRGKGGLKKGGNTAQLLEGMCTLNKNPCYLAAEESLLGVKARDGVGHIRDIPASCLKLQHAIGEGAFGQVYKGEMTDPDTLQVEAVAVKTLKDGVTQELRLDFNREVEIMSAFDHENILKLLGVANFNGNEALCMVFEYMSHGDLADLLRDNDPCLSRAASPSSWTRLSRDCCPLQAELVSIAVQVSAGMRYLASQHFVHRDLAARNCLVGTGLVVKIADFGMSRDIYTCDYYRIGGSRKLPVRWMSPESVKYGRFTTESDVWAFGVLLWEIFSFGRQPYYGHSNEEVLRFIEDGILLQRPSDCPTTVHHVMVGCWKKNPRERLTFDRIHKYLTDYSRQVAACSASQQAKSALDPRPTSSSDDVITSCDATVVCLPE